MKNIWIIGASAGIGRDLALEYAKNGDNVAISARSSDDLNKLEKEIVKAQGLSKKFQNFNLPLDVLKKSEVKRSFNKIIKNWQKIDAFIYVSGIYKPMKSTEIDVEFAKKTIDINLTSVFDFLALIIPQMQKQKSGQIALTASVAGYRGLPNSLAYGASKAAMINLGETLYSELKPENIDISIICPGFVKTRLTDKNSFKMPAIITSEEAAKIIYRDLKKKKFEIHFPKKFTFFMKLLKIMPNWLFLKIAQKIKP